MGRGALKYEVVKAEKQKTRETVKNILFEKISLIEEELCEEDENCSLLQGIDRK